MALFHQKEKRKEEELEAPSPYPGDVKDEIRQQEMEKSLEFPRYSPITLSEAESLPEMEDMEESSMGSKFNVPKWDNPPKPAENYSRGQSLFVKVDRYNDLLELITSIKKKLSNADSILKELDDIRLEEEKELKTWQSDLSSIKEGLVAIDEKLFEA